MTDLTGSTDSNQLRRIRNWSDHEAWEGFSRRYRPVLMNWSRKNIPDEAEAEDFCQTLLLELASRLQSFRYDARKGRFRGWLRLFFKRRLSNHQRAAIAVQPMDPARIAAIADQCARPIVETHEPQDRQKRRLLAALARRALRIVKSRSKPLTWLAFWKIEIQGQSVREAADALGIEYFLAYRHHQRILARLAKERDRILRNEGHANPDLEE